MYIVLIVVCNVEKREDPKGTSQASLKYSEEPTQQQQQSKAIPLQRRNLARIPQSEPPIRDNNLYRNGDGSYGSDMAPLLSNPNQRQLRPGDVNTSASLPEYNRPNDKQYPVSTRKKSGPGESGDVGHYVGRSPEHEQPLPYVKYFTSVFFFIWTGGCSIDTLHFYLCAYILMPHYRLL
jgi:hypothetical protein